jgi:catecholate siderophore receptor
MTLLPKTSGIVARRHGPAMALAAALTPALAAWLAPGPAAAAEADAAATSNLLDGLTVTAQSSPPINTISKLPQNLQDIPQSITVLDHELLQSQGATSLADALRNVPGITIGGAEGGQIGNNINLDGFTARTDIYLDGFRDRGQYYRDTFALDSVEVLMGPSSMLFGRGSTGGVINQVSKTASLTPKAEFDLSATTNGLARGTADLDAPIDDKSAVRVSVMGQDGAASTRKQTTVDDYGVAPVYRWGIGTPTEVTVSGLLQHNNDRPDYGVPPLNGHPAQAGYNNTVYGYSTDRTVQDIVAGGLQVKHKLANGVTLRDQVQYNGVDTNAVETAAHAIGTVGAKGFVALPTAYSTAPLSSLAVELQGHDRVIHDTSLFDQAEASGQFTALGMTHDWLIGAEFGHDHYANQGYYRTGACNGVALPTGYVGCVTLLNPVYAASPTSTETAGNLAGGKADTQAGYVSDTLTVTPQIKLVGGVRYDNYAAAISNSVNSANTAGNTAFPSLSQTVDFTSVRGGAIWQPAKAQSYYLSYSTSFDPSLEQLTSTTGLTRALPPENNVAYEGGAKWALLKGQLDVDAAAFQITQYNSRSQNADGTYSPNGSVRVRGVRLGATGKITRAWMVYGGYTHLDAKIIQAIAVGTLGKVPQNTPGDAATAWTTYDITPAIQIGGGATYQSQRYMNNTDAVSAPGYTRLDATIAWRQAHYDIRLNVFNLADAHFYDNVIQSDGGRAVPGIGRTAMLSLVWRP